MKKNYSIIALFVVLAMIVTVFTACNGNKAEEETTVPEVTASATGYTAEINSADALILKDGKEFQTLKYPQGIPHSIDLEYAKDHYEFIDMNFDGNEDFYIAVSNVDGVISYYCWLYNASTNEFEFSASLSALKNISVDSTEQLILSETVFEGGRQISTYTWEDGSLVYGEAYNENDGAIPENVTASAEGNKIGDVSNTDKATTSATTQKADKDDKDNKDDKNDKTTKEDKPDSNNKTTKEDKPEKTTVPKTTKPLLTTTTPSNDIVLETGDPDEGWF